jgi:hypothetical protein
VASFSEGDFDIVPQGPNFFELRRKRMTSFAMDIGGVLEFYPSKRIITRFRTVPFIRPARTTHNFQFVASVGFRF